MQQIAAVNTSVANDLAIDVAAGASLAVGGLGNVAGQTINKANTGVLAISGAQSHGDGAALLVAGGTVNLDSDAGTPASSQSPALANLSIAVTGGQMRLMAGQTLKAMTADVAEGIDLRGMHVWIYTTADEAALNAQLRDGRIIDSTIGTHAGASIGIASRSDAGGSPVLLLRLTRPGDANCDVSVNFTDLLRLSQNYGANGRAWDEGDFTYDGQVNFDDLLKLSQNYGQVFAGADAAALPEPAAIGWLLAGLAMWGRRR